MSLQLNSRPIEPFGVQIDLDVSKELTSDQVDAIRSAFYQHQLLLFRDQDLSYERQRKFVKNFGPVLSETDEYRVISNVVDGGGLGNVALGLHSDLAYLPEPYLAISLHAIEVDNGTTSTFFQNNTRAYHRLSDEMKEKLGKLQVRNVFNVNTNARNRFNPDLPHHVHPLIWKNPGSGEPILWLSEIQSADIVGLSEAESDALLDALHAEARRDNIYEHKWHEGDLILWDNRSLTHGRDAVSEKPRTLQRIVVSQKTAQQQMPDFQLTDYGGDKLTLSRKPAGAASLD